MHDLSDLLLEAVVNSVEAGAGVIEASVEIEDGMARIRIEDDGMYTLSSDPFQDGSTTKGEGRGHGLFIIHERSSGRCRLTRGDGRTQLEFMAEDDGSFSDAAAALLPVFGMGGGITVTIRKDGGVKKVSSALLEERDAVPDRAEGIRNFRNLLEGL